MTDCLFCRIAKGEVAGDMVYEDDTVVAFNDIYPQAPIHFLVVPRAHISMIADMGLYQSELIGRLFHVAADICWQKGITDYRLVINNGKVAGRSFGWPPG